MLDPTLLYASGNLRLLGFAQPGKLVLAMGYTHAANNSITYSRFSG
jgi:hypothetical protein